METNREGRYHALFFTLIFSLLALRLVLFVDEYAVDLFYNDQWAYLRTSIFPSDFLTGFMTQLGPHRIGLSFLFFEQILVLSDFNNRAIAFMVVAFSVINAGLFTILKVRYVAPLHCTDIYIPLVFFNLNQYAIYLNNPNISIHQLIIFFVLMVVWLFSGEVRPWKIILLFLFVPLLTFTGNGFFLTASLLIISVLAGLIARQKGMKIWSLGLVAVALISIITYLFMAFESTKTCADSPLQEPLHYLKFVKGMILNGLVISYQESYLSWLMFTLTLLFGGWLIRKHLALNLSLAKLAPLLLIIYSALFIGGALWGRWCFSLVITESSRYIPHCTLGFMGLALLLRNRCNAIKFGFPLFLALMFIYGEYKFQQWYLPNVQELSSNLRAWKQCYQEHNSASTCTERLDFAPFPKEDIERARLQQKLEALERLNPSYQKVVQ
mgnify:CR=1 FL=1